MIYIDDENSSYESDSLTNTTDLRFFHPICAATNQVGMSTTDVRPLWKPDLDQIDPFMRVDQLPGIGKVYARRLRDKSIYTLGDLRQLLDIKCAGSEAKFESELKNAGIMRTDIIRKCAQIIRTCPYPVNYYKP